MVFIVGTAPPSSTHDPEVELFVGPVLLKVVGASLIETVVGFSPINVIN